MLRYRITTDPCQRYIVVPASALISPPADTYATREAAQDMADWFNLVAARELAVENGPASEVAVRR